jgi:hypothetical protein
LKNYYQKLLWGLFVLAIVLLSVNIFLQFVLKKNESLESFALENKDIQDRFITTITNFGLKEEWIKKKIVDEIKTSLSYPHYKISIPTDLSIPEVFLDIYNEFKEDSLHFQSIEKKVGGRSILTLKTNNHTLLQAEFNYSNRISRDRGAIAFILQDIELDNLDDSVLVESADKFNILLVPSEENLDHLSFIRENRKNYSILINDEINDPNYKLDVSYSQLRLLNVIKALSVDYANSSFFVIDDNSDFYKSAKYNFFRDETIKRKIKLYKYTDFKFLENDESIVSVFNNEMKDLNKEENKVFLLSKNSYLHLKPDILLYKKTGVKIVNTSEID